MRLKLRLAGGHARLPSHRISLNPSALADEALLALPSPHVSCRAIRCSSRSESMHLSAFVAGFRLMPPRHCMRIAQPCLRLAGGRGCSRGGLTSRRRADGMGRVGQGTPWWRRGRQIALRSGVVKPSSFYPHTSKSMDREERTKVKGKRRGDPVISGEAPGFKCFPMQCRQHGSHLS